ncbi:MAG: hypothetical protein ACI867_000081, partial [Glaciecola sp.]
DAFRAPEVAARLKPDAATAFGLGIADAVITESGDPIANGWAAVTFALGALSTQDAHQRVADRHARWRSAPSPR